MNIACPECGCTDFEKRGLRRTYHPLDASLEADGWNEGDIEMDMFDNEDEEIIYCCGCNREFREAQLLLVKGIREALADETVNMPPLDTEG